MLNTDNNVDEDAWSDLSHGKSLSDITILTPFQPLPDSEILYQMR